jgi:hypothetical protein
MVVLQVLLAVLSLLSAAACARAWVFLRRVRRLADVEALEPTGGWPKVTAIVPARNEAARIADALRTRLDDDYPDLEVVLVDDRSDDGTPDVAQHAAAGDDRFVLVCVSVLPAGWIGKVHALDTGVRCARGDWLLFSDADVHLAPDALRRAVSLAEREGLDMVAAVPTYVSSSLLCEAIWSVFLRVFSMSVDPTAVRDPGSRAAMGSGAFNLVRRTAFEKTPGFEHLRLETGDDMALGQMVKQAGGRLEPVNGAGFVSVRMYDSVGDFLHGVEKNGSTTAEHPWRATAVLAGLVALDWAPFVALALGPAWLRAVAAACALICIAANVYCLRGNGRPGWRALAYPIGTVLMAVGLLRSTWMAVRARGVSWRGTFYSLEELAQGRRFEM